MVANRDSINKAAAALCELVFEGGMILPSHVAAAQRLHKLVKNTGMYAKRYDTHEERVLNRHLNLYINKREKARTEAERTAWHAKVLAQQAKIKAFKGGVSQDGTDDLDLDGL